MSLVNVKKYFESVGLGERVKDLSDSSATVELAAQAVGCEAKQIVKTMTFLVSEKPIMIVCAGNVKIDNSKYKAQFYEKAKMIPAAMVEEYIGHGIGGICPFVVKDGVSVYLDESLKVNSVVYPGAGNEHSVVELSLQELEDNARAIAWIDVCKVIE
ncbi:MAG: YbaK/EbsC family protein [Smithella sp.]|nr:YbaK/EbsC family protein [Chloroflexota bacterium]